jgi:hypothetical protein
MHLKNGLRDIQSDRRDLLHSHSPSDSTADQAAGWEESRPRHHEQKFPFARRIASIDTRRKFHAQ